MKGQINIYTCEECGGRTVTVDRDEGVTPFMIGCRAAGSCSGTAFSCFYTVPDPKPEPAWEWYLPSEEEARLEDKKSPGSFEHFKQGGLSLRKIQLGPAPWKCLTCGAGIADSDTASGHILHGHVVEGIGGTPKPRT